MNIQGYRGRKMIAMVQQFQSVTEDDEITPTTANASLLEVGPTSSQVHNDSFEDISILETSCYEDSGSSYYPSDASDKLSVSCDEGGTLGANTVNGSYVFLDPVTGILSEHNTQTAENLPLMHNQEVVPPRKRARKGNADPSTWKQNMNKIAKMKGKQYIGLKTQNGSASRVADTKVPREMRRRCSSNKCLSSKSKKKCGQLSEEQRSDLFTEFWQNMDWESRKHYVATLVHKIPVKKTTVRTQSRRSCSFEYNLKVNSQILPVCKQMFLSTLGLGEWSVWSWVKQSRSSGILPSKQTQKISVNNVKKQSMIEFIKKLPTVPSHYCRASTSKSYLEPLFASYADVYKLYLEKAGHETLGRDVFIKTLNQMNIGLFQPRKDQCDLCFAHKLGNLNASDEYDKHILKKDRARIEKNNDKLEATAKKICAYTMDVQAVQLVPYTKASALYFKQKLACHHFTIYNMGNGMVTSYVWHEGEGGMDSNVFTTCIIDFLKEEVTDEEKNLPQVFYSDGCCAQNRNVTLSNALNKFSNDNKVTIFQKYLVKGHSQMECDSVHAVVERRKKNRELFSPSNYVSLIEGSRSGKAGSYKVKYVDHTFFNDYSEIEYYKSIRPGKKAGDACVTNIRALKYSPEILGIQFKLDFDDEWSDMPRRALTPVSSANVKKLYTSPIPINKRKYDDLQSLKPVIHKDYHGFYNSLVHE